MTTKIPPYQRALTRAGRAFATARARREIARDTLKSEALAALDAGMSEVQVAKAAGVDRMTIRSWQGKRR